MTYIRIIHSIDDSWTGLIKDDPVRPEIPLEDRINGNAEVIFLVDEQDEPMAAVCVRYCSEVPSMVDEMLSDPGPANVAVFYTIWSYRSGAGGKLIFAAREHILKTRPQITRFVTLSPQTEMAKRFHLKNGASIFRENSETVNYEYAA